jgi:thiol-disulfide isomerase/thioredoxin
VLRPLRHQFLRAVLLAGACSSPRTADDREVELPFALGNPAPKLEVQSFLKGEPATDFEPGRVHVIEFRATWCAACIPCFAHLSKLQELYGDGVTVVGVDIWEESYTSATLDAVAEYVARHGDDMRYTVAYDGQAARADRAYMGAAGQHGIPYAFVVDGRGRPAWMGVPRAGDSAELDGVLREVVAGRYDPTAAHTSKPATSTAPEAVDERLEELVRRLTAAYQIQDSDLVLERLDELDRYQGGSRTAYHMNRFSVLLRHRQDYAAAYAMKDALLSIQRIATNYQDLDQIAWSVVDPRGTVAPADRDLDFALVFATRANEVARGEDAVVLNTLARVERERGRRDEAIEIQRRSVPAARRADSGIDATLIGELESTLADFERSAGRRDGG